MLARLRFALLAAAFAACAARAAADSQSPELAALLERLRARGAFSARFVEEKQLAVLAAPLESRGEIAFTPPDRLRWEVTGPVASQLLVEGARVELRQPGAPPRRLDLGQDPGLLALVEALRRLLAGDLGALRRAYDARLAGDAAGWRIVLSPRAPALRRVLAVLELTGADDRPRELLLRFANGDRSRVVFEVLP